MSRIANSLWHGGTALRTLWRDPATGQAVAEALRPLGDGDGDGWWPYAAWITAEKVAVHLAGAQCPSPPEPWHLGPNGRVWLVTRHDLARSYGQEPQPGSAASAATPDASRGRLNRSNPVLLGAYRGGLVYIDAARAPGLLLVAGDEPAASRVYALLTAQLPAAMLARAAPGLAATAHWLIDVRDRREISVLGSRIATVLERPGRFVPVPPKTQPTPPAVPPGPPTRADSDATAAARRSKDSAESPGDGRPRSSSARGCSARGSTARGSAAPGSSAMTAAPQAVRFEAPAVSAREEELRPVRPSPAVRPVETVAPALQTHTPAASAQRPERSAAPVPIEWADAAVSSAGDG